MWKYLKIKIEHYYSNTWPKTKISSIISFTKYLYFLRYGVIWQTPKFTASPNLNFCPEEPKNLNFTFPFLVHYPWPKLNVKTLKDPNLIHIFNMKLVCTWFLPLLSAGDTFLSPCFARSKLRWVNMYVECCQVQARTCSTERMRKPAECHWSTYIWPPVLSFHKDKSLDSSSPTSPAAPEAKIMCGNIAKMSPNFASSGWNSPWQWFGWLIMGCRSHAGDTPSRPRVNYSCCCCCCCCCLPERIGKVVIVTGKRWEGVG